MLVGCDMVVVGAGDEVVAAGEVTVGVLAPSLAAVAHATVASTRTDPRTRRRTDLNSGRGCSQCGVISVPCSGHSTVFAPPW